MKRTVVINNASAYTAIQAQPANTFGWLFLIVHRRRQLKNSGFMLLLTVCFFCIYSADVVAGAYFRAAFLSDIAAVLMLVMASVCFTVAIVELERRDKANTANDGNAES